MKYLVSSEKDINNIIFATISSVNWLKALSFELEERHGDTEELWAESLSNHFLGLNIKKINDFSNEEQTEIFRKLTSSIIFSWSIKELNLKDGNLYQMGVGAVADFFYCLSHSISLMLKLNTGHTPTNHESMIKHYSNSALRGEMPHPFNAFLKRTNDPTNLISKKDYEAIFPSLSLNIKKSKGNINSPKHRNGLVSRDDSIDILAGYLFGVFGFKYDDRKLALKKKGIERFTKAEDKEKLKKSLPNEFSFMDCLYRYRTKFHYRENICFASSMSHGDWDNQGMVDSEYFKSLQTVSRFIVMCAFRCLDRSMERDALLDFCKELETVLVVKSADDFFWKPLFA